MLRDNEPVTATDAMSPLSVANFVLRHRRLLFGLPVLAFLVSLAVSYAVGVGYASRSSFVPQMPESNASRISALAAQFALIAGGSSSGESV
jgi:C4-dicarboxylate transporter